ncbi:helix-turn-helix domain-containing protein [Methylobacterium sp. J-090]|uniref:helix-turn-helix domain-containing protein n=1 Tax=Methylobacterium sp. J-090 TaxID=2836666 RepID=UPI001FB98B52|nr:helix-turn-helix transcriptional regulator [Methylobacterium sp. J-090]MCJ2080007.1 helix-turn-helix domain-containing protein [Methylobacterium sp. J-090]
MTVVRTRTPSGEAIVIVPEAEFERLTALAEDALDGKALSASKARIDGGTEDLLSEADLDALRAAPTPLAFWRARRGVETAALAERAGLAESDLVAMEGGAAVSDITRYRALAEALGVDMDDLVPDAEAA